MNMIENCNRNVWHYTEKAISYNPYAARLLALPLSIYHLFEKIILRPVEIAVKAVRYYQNLSIIQKSIQFSGHNPDSLRIYNASKKKLYFYIKKFVITLAFSPITFTVAVIIDLPVRLFQFLWNPAQSLRKDLESCIFTTLEPLNDLVDKATVITLTEATQSYLASLSLQELMNITQQDGNRGYLKTIIKARIEQLLENAPNFEEKLLNKQAPRDPYPFLYQPFSDGVLEKIVSHLEYHDQIKLMTSYGNKSWCRATQKAIEKRKLEALQNLAKLLYEKFYFLLEVEEIKTLTQIINTSTATLSAQEIKSYLQDWKNRMASISTVGLSYSTLEYGGIGDLLYYNNIQSKPDYFTDYTSFDIALIQGDFKTAIILALEKSATKSGFYTKTCKILSTYLEFGKEIDRFSPLIFDLLKLIPPISIDEIASKNRLLLILGSQYASIGRLSEAEKMMKSISHHADKVVLLAIIIKKYAKKRDFAAVQRLEKDELSNVDYINLRISLHNFLSIFYAQNNVQTENIEFNTLLEEVSIFLAQDDFDNAIRVVKKYQNFFDDDRTNIGWLLIFRQYVQQDNLQQATSSIENLSENIYKVIAYSTLFKEYIERKNYAESEKILQQIDSISQNNQRSDLAYISHLIGLYTIDSDPLSIRLRLDDICDDDNSTSFTDYYLTYTYSQATTFSCAQFLSIALALEYARNADFEKAESIIKLLPGNDNMPMSQNQKDTKTMIQIELAQAYARINDFQNAFEICQQLENRDLYEEGLEMIFSIAYKQNETEFFKTNDITTTIQYQHWELGEKEREKTPFLLSDIKHLTYDQIPKHILSREQSRYKKIKAEYVHAYNQITLHQKEFLL